MQLNWSSIECLKGLGIDMWILVPTGMGVNRLLKNDGNISDAWLDKLEKFLGLDRNTIIDYFYKTVKSETLFGAVQMIIKEEDAISKSALLYKERLNEVFDFVSEPFELKNSTNSIMYHLFCATNNKTALKIANEVIMKFQIE
jgi:three-Cys-motif partner protein